MKKVLILIPALIFCATDLWAAPKKDPFEMECRDTGIDNKIRRCENGEVICYYFATPTGHSGMQCKFK